VALAGLIRQWNQRKERLFTDDHVRAAIKHLEELNWAR
jgi:hypothetical protein